MSRALDKLLRTIQPTCHDAIRLAELGAERPLTTSERLSLKFNSRLCINCNCSRRKFEALMEKMRAAEAARKG